MRKCPICDRWFTDYPAMRRDAKGVYWCMECTNDFDSIDWDEVRQII